MARELGEKQLSLDTRRGSRRLFDLVYSRSDIPPELLRDRQDTPGTGIGMDTRLTPLGRQHRTQTRASLDQRVMGLGRNSSLHPRDRLSPFPRVLLVKRLLITD